METPSTTETGANGAKGAHVVLPKVPENHCKIQGPKPSSLKQLFLKGLRLLPPVVRRKLLPSSSTIRSASLTQRFIPPQDIQRIVVLGIHGWFPGRFLQTVTGEPTGRSDVFADKMAQSVLNYFSSLNGMVGSSGSLPTVTRIPLVSEGRVLSRVETFYKTLLDGWAEALQRADLILFAAHSQGTLVGTLLLNRLVTDRLIDPLSQRIGLLGMAGICHGPFPHLRSSLIVKYVEADAARELFEFNSPSSYISVTFQSAMMNLLHSGVRVALVGSWYDQVVPLYSAILYGIDHPRLFRALYIDANDYNPDFLSHLIVFALKLKNSGIPDYGLLVHLSDCLAGNIYGFGTQGHSAIYEFADTFDVAVKWTFAEEPASLRESINVPVTAKSLHFKAPLTSKLNPYMLPWIMAHLLAQGNLPSELKIELENLIELYKVWDPKTKEAKDIKYRLEGLKAKL